MDVKRILKNMEGFYTSRSGAIILIVSLGILAHSFMVSGSYKTLDDNYSIVANDLVKDVRHIPEILTSSYFGENAYWRPLVMLTYLAEVQAFGLNPFYFYLTNIALHVSSSTFVYLIVGFFLQRRSLAFASGLLFAIHPIHWVAVSNISGRAILLSALLYFAAFYFFLLFERTRKRWGFLGLSLACFWLSLMSKESAMMLPVLVMFYLWLFKKEKGFRLKEFSTAFPYFALLAVYLIIRRVLGIVNIFMVSSFEQSALCFLTFLRSVLTHLRCFIFPFDLHYDRSMAVYASFSDVRLWLVVLVFGVGLMILVRSWPRIPTALKFFGAWFFLDLFPVSQILVPVGTQPGWISTAEHFLYSASIGVFVVMAVLSAQLYDFNLRRKHLDPAILRFVFASAFLFFLLSTIRQNIFATSELAMLKESLRHNPHNTRILDSYGFALVKGGRFSEAEGFFRKVLEINPAHVRSRISLGKVLCDQGRCVEGMLEYEKVRDPDAFSDLLQQNKKATFAIILKEYAALIEREPHNARAHYSIGIIYAKTERLHEAAGSFNRALELDPQFKEAAFNLANVYEGLGETARAKEYFARSLSLPGTDQELDIYAQRRLKELP